MNTIERFKNFKDIEIKIYRADVVDISVDVPDFAKEVAVSFTTKYIDQRQVIDFAVEVDALLSKYRLKGLYNRFVNEDNTPPSWFSISEE